jgi:hypothetical protein
MPPKQSLRPDQEGTPALPRQDAACRGHKGPIRRTEGRPSHLAPEHGELVAQDHDLDVLVGLVHPTEHQELEEAPKHYIKDGEDQPRILPSRRLVDQLPRSGRD